MLDFPDDITWQARQGKVAAILQILRQEFTEMGLQVRAVLQNGVLHLLCEIDAKEPPEREVLLPRIQSIFTSLTPDLIRQIRIYGRAAQDQPLVWFGENGFLEGRSSEQNSDNNSDNNSENHLPSCWQDNIFLEQPHQSHQLSSHSRQSTQELALTPELRQHHQFQRGLVLGVALSSILGLISFAGYQALSPPQPKSLNSQFSQTSSVSEPNSGNPVRSNSSSTQRLDSNPRSTPNSDSNNLNSENSSPDSPPNPEKDRILQQDEANFAEAVRLAQEAVEDGKFAQWPEEWESIADKWQRAADLMSEVSDAYPRSATAQNRAALYRRNAEVAQQEALRY